MNKKQDQSSNKNWFFENKNGKRSCKIIQEKKEKGSKKVKKQKSPTMIYASEIKYYHS